MYETDVKKRARAIRAEWGVAGTGTEQVGIEFELLDEQGTETWYGSFASDKAAEIALKGMRAAGWKGTDLTDLSSLDASQTQTPEVDLVIGDDSYTAANGEQRVTRKVKFINTRGGIAMKNPLQGDRLKAFAARMKGTVLAFDQRAGTPKDAQQTRPAQAAQRPAPSNSEPVEHDWRTGPPSGKTEDPLPF